MKGPYFRVLSASNSILLLLALAFGGLSQIQAQDWNPSNGLVAYYPLDGNLNDYSGNSNNGINGGATFTTDRFGNSNAALAVTTTTGFISENNVGITGNSPRTLSLGRYKF
jgi:hypothetical protein